MDTIDIMGKAVTYIKLLVNKQDANGYLKQFSLEEQLEILIETNIIADYLKYSEFSNDMRNMCYSCRYRCRIPGDTHSGCMNKNAKVIGDPHGINHGWFFHPFNFDPTWLIYCDGYEKDTTNK